MNSRISKRAEAHNIFVDEQNGFRRNRSCLDHVYALNTIIQNRKQRSMYTFVAFVDMGKAFDRVDRDLLFYKLLKLGIGGKVYNCLKDMYDGCKTSVNINGYITDSFYTEFGEKQGDCLSPTLFGLFMNDIVTDIKENSSGVSLDGLKIHCLLYADD